MEVGKANALRVITAVSVLLTTVGCVGMAKKEMREDLVAQCAANGRVFVEREAINQGGLFDTVKIAGSCLGPDDEGYAEAVAKARDEADVEAKPDQR